MRRLFSMRIPSLKARLRRHEQGQSLVLLAIGFVALALFVGITTDVSVLFARYSQLARAVDSAAISAANQVREDRNYANVRLAATQFIEIYGLDPEQIDVQYCDTLPATERTTDELCVDFAGNAHNRKLVRVTARVEAPTYFMRLLGIDVIELEASSISETAALDVVVIMDVSESMLRYTNYEDWARIGQGVIYRPPTRNEIAADLGISIANLMTDPSDPQTGLLYRTQAYVNGLLNYTDSEDPFYVASNSTHFQAEYGTQGAPREDCQVRFYPASIYSGVSFYTGYGDSDTGYTDLLTLYEETGLGWPEPPPGSPEAWGGFVPTYNFYGCCNDPNGDGVFDDLVCQPFAQARDAVLQFMDRIDFNRGDRVAFVTFDQGAYLINPYGVPITDGTPDEDGRLNHMISNRNDAENTIRRLLGVRAEPNFYVYDNNGTYVEGSTDRITARWSGYAAGIRDGESIPFDPGRTDYDPDPTTGIVPEMINYPVRQNCFVQNAALAYEWESLFKGSLLSIANPTGAEWADYADGPWALYPDWLPEPGVQRDWAMTYEFNAACAGTNVGAGLRVANNALVDPETIRDDGVWVMVLLSDGGAGASDAVRRDGDKIAPILPYQDNLDGTFGYENPAVDEYGSYGLCPMGTPDNPAELMLPNDDSPVPFSFPHCSDEQWWTRHRCDFRPLRIVLFGQNDAMQDNDYNPALSEEENLRLNNLYDVDIGQPGVNCNVERYDVDDYARDWADYIGLQAIAGSGAQEANLPTIFTIGFGLEFPVRSDGGTTYSITDQDDAEEICALNPGDCLGEQLLRYIADVGDNNFIDNDYYQDILFCDRQDALDGRCEAHGAYGVGLFPMESWSWDGIPGDIRGYGQRGPCQTELGIVIGSTYDLNGDGLFDEGERRLQREMLRPQLSCGNYYFAPDGNELRFVFDDIASRMYTRLAR